MLTLVVSVVSLHVHGQSWHTGVEFVTNCAVFTIVRVDLPVSAEVAAGGEMFATIWTGFALLATG